MIKFSRKTEYALIAIQHIISKGISEPATAKEISDNYNIPYELLAKILQLLAKKNIISSIKGVNGGYKFLKNPEEVKLSEIINSLNESYSLTRCQSKVEKKIKECEIREYCTLKNPIVNVQKKLNMFFDEITIKQLI
jgi:Rrf2 family protein